MREGKEILANEIGVVFKPKSKRTKDVAGSFDPNIVSTSGTVEGGVYSNRAAHFEWLCDVGTSIGLGFEDLGKRRHGSEATLHFCDKLYEIYGSDDLSVSLGASFAIEHCEPPTHPAHPLAGVRPCTRAHARASQHNAPAREGAATREGGSRTTPLPCICAHRRGERRLLGRPRRRLHHAQRAAGPRRDPRRRQRLASCAARFLEVPPGGRSPVHPEPSPEQLLPSPRPEM